MNDLFFIDDTRPNQPSAANPKWQVLISDDEQEVHDITKLALHGLVYQERQLDFISAYSAKETIELLHKHPDIAVILLDVVMEETNSGLVVAKAIRLNLNNKDVRIILRTGQPGQAIEREVIFDYDINDYKEKSDLTSQKLFTSVVAALRSFSDILTIKRKNEVLESLNQDLLQAKKALEKESMVKSQFLSNVTHEIRTPMNGIVGMASLLSLTDLNEQQKSYLQLINFSADILVKTVSDIIDISQMEIGKVELAEDSFDFRQFFIKILDPYIFSARAKNIDLTYYLAPDIPDFIKCDKHRLKQILINIVSNAVKFTLKGTISINVFVTYKEKEKVQLKFEVSDSGVGISEDKFDEIFEPFVQENLSNTKTFQGIGLGLSVSKRLVELMGGSITVNSEKGKGSNFSFTINVDKSK